jgi:hypothetical protein
MNFRGRFSDKLRRAAAMTAEAVLSLHIRADIQNVFNISCPRVAAEFIFDLIVVDGLATVFGPTNAVGSAFRFLAAIRKRSCTVVIFVHAVHHW